MAMTTWQKESTHQDALYVNLFSSPEKLELEYASRIKYETHDRHPMQKCNTMAENDRKEGNLFFAQGDWYMATVKYNRGLWFAETGSAQMGMLYANRSACFKQKKMYDKCLIDIELAKSTNCPQRVMEKLEARKEECLKLIAAGSNMEPDEPKLSFATSTEFPGMANVLKVEMDQKFGVQVKATKNLHVGATVLVEDFYFADSYMEECSTCVVCQKLDMNLVPCGNCTLALVCHDCKHSDLHRFECSLREFPGFTFNKEHETVQKPIIRSMFLAVKNFPNVDVLMAFVEDVVGNGTNTLSWNDERSKYRSFLTLDTTDNDIELMWIYRIYKPLLQIPEIAAYFPDEKHRRFLMHLIRQHISIFMRNFLIDSVVGGTVPNYYTCGIGVLAPHLSHSCMPNTVLYLDHGSIVGKVIQPIKSGERLTTVNTPGLQWSFDETKNYLKRINGIHCECQCSKFNVMRLGFDGNFRLLCDNILRDSDFETDQTLRKLLFDRVFTNFGNVMWSSKLMKVCLDYYIEMHKRKSIITTIRRQFKNSEAFVQHISGGSKEEYEEQEVD